MHYINYSVTSRRLVYYRWRCSKCNEINTSQYSVTSKDSYFTPGRRVEQSNFDMLKEQGANTISLKVYSMNFGQKSFKTGKVSGCCHHCGNVEPWTSEFRYKKAIGFFAYLASIIGFIAACYIGYANDIKLGLFLVVFSLFPLLIYRSEKKNTAKELTAALPDESIPVQVYSFGFGKLGTIEEMIQSRIEELENQKDEQLQQTQRQRKASSPELSKQSLSSFLAESRGCVRFSEILANWKKLGLDQNEQYDSITNELISKNNIERLYGIDKVSVQKYLNELEEKYVGI